MSAGAMVIELGDDRAPPQGAWPPRRRGPLLLVSVLLVAALGGAAPAHAALSELFSVPFDVRSDYAVSADALYVVRLRQVNAYTLPWGTHRWSATLTQPVSAVLPMETAGVVLAVTVRGDETGLLALDAGTGRIRWRDYQGQLWGVLGAAGWVLLRSGGEVRALDPATGRAVWRRATGPGWSLPDPDPRQGAAPWLVFQSDDGTTEVVDAASGATRIRVRLALPRPAPGSGGVVPLVARSVVGSRLLTAVQQGETSVLEAYDLATLSRQWQVTLRPAAYNVTDCGSVLCVDGPGSLSAVDPASGALLWTTGPWQQASPLRADRLLVSGADVGVSTSIVDAHTLRPVLALTRWYPVGTLRDGSPLLARDDTGLRSWFATLDAARPRLSVLGQAWGVQLAQCTATGRYLACPDVRDRLRVWRYRNPA